MHPAIGVAHSSTWQQQELHPPWTDLQSALSLRLFYCLACHCPLPDKYAGAFAVPMP